MADWQEQLNTILSDPDAMSQIAALAQSIQGGASPHTGAASGDRTMPHVDGKSEKGQVPREDSPPHGENGDRGETIRNMLGGLDPELLRRLLPLLRQMERPESSETTAFLLALRPFLSEKRRGKVERAAQLARLIHLGKTFLTTQGPEEAERV